MRPAARSFLLTAAVSARTPAKSPPIATSQGFFALAGNVILRSAEKIPDNLCPSSPREVRTAGHIADRQYNSPAWPSNSRSSIRISRTGAQCRQASLWSARISGYGRCDRTSCTSFRRAGVPGGMQGDPALGEGVWLLPASRWAEYKLPPQMLTRGIKHQQDWIRECKGGAPGVSEFAVAPKYIEWLASESRCACG